MRARDLKVLEYQKIISKVAQHAQSDMGHEQVLLSSPASDLEVALILQKETAEARRIFESKGQPSFAGVHDVRAPIQRARIQGVLNEQEIVNIAACLRATRLFDRFWRDYEKQYVKNRDLELSVLWKYVSQLQPVSDLEKEIDRCIDEHAQIKDNASVQLAQIRRKLHNVKDKARKKLEEIVRNNTKQKMLQELIITTRNDRYVIPVKQEYRNVFGGMVHDQSASGATLFIEPQVVVELNNQQRELQIQEKNEIDRILQELTEKIAVYAEVILTNLHELVKLDVIFARASYASEMRAVEPLLNDRGIINARKVKHPLLDVDQAVPIDFNLGEKFATIVITGPNTGGKTVALKTIGLTTILASSGLQITAEPGCQFSIFKGVYADIGDEQSIEQSLSTFSGHMTNIIAILDIATSSSMILMDELGAGTDPQEGAALAMAILTHLHKRKITTVATTHYSELKQFAYDTEGMTNASVEFDVNTLSPTYRLLIGVPGQSNALAIARRLGLAEQYITTAESFVSKEQKDVNQMLIELDKNRRQLERQQAEWQKKHKDLEAEVQQFEQERNKWQAQSDNRLKQIEVKAKQELIAAKQQVEKLILEIRELQKQENGVKDHILVEKKKQLEQIGETLLHNNKQQGQINSEAGNRKYSAGEEVEVNSLRQKGFVLQQVNQNEYLVQVGIMKVTLPTHDLKPIKAKTDKVFRDIVKLKGGDEHVSIELDVRGKTIEEAIHEVEQYIDRVILSNLTQVTIIHGKGTGALRSGLTDYLKYHPGIKKIRSGEAGEGGSGVTVVSL